MLPFLRAKKIELPSKTIILAGKEVSICGSPDDGYFGNMQGQVLANSFLERVAAERLGPDAVIFDIGANIGLTTILFANHAPKGRVTSFEPSPVAFKFLKDTIAANRLTNAEAVNVALGAATGEFPFMDDPGSATASHLSMDGTLGQPTHMVRVEKLDDTARNHTRLDFIKIDVEGHERGVLEGGLSTIKRLKPLLFVEVNAFTLMAYGNDNSRAFLEYLQTLFSDIQYMDDEGIKHVNTKHELWRFLHTNLIHHGCVSDILCIP